MFQPTEYGALASVPMVVQAPPPAGRRWNSAEATPEPESAESEETATEAPRRAAPSAGAVSEPVGAVSPKVNAAQGRLGVAGLVRRADAHGVRPSAGKFEAGKARDQSPLTRPALAHVSLPAENEAPFQ